jgi:hypothetical protein
MLHLVKRAVAVGLVGALSMAALVASGDQTFGAGVKLTEVTAIKALYESPERFIGKTIRIDGVVSAVCEEMGCWIALATKDRPDEAVRFKVDEGKGVVFPMSAKGRAASAEGVFEKIAAGDKDANEAAQEQAAKQPKAPEFTKTYQVKATGAVVR